MIVDLQGLLDKEAELREKAKQTQQMHRYFEDAANQVKKVIETIQREVSRLEVKLRSLENDTKQRLTQ